MVYHPKTIRALGIAQIVIGGILIALGIGVFFVRTNSDSSYAKYVAYGIWIGCWVLATGLLGFFGSRHPQIPSKCLLGTFMGFAITSCVMSGIMLISYAIALSYVPGSRYIFYSRYTGTAVMFIIFILMSITEFFISLASSIYCCNAVCSNNGVMATQQVVYFQPGVGQMQGGMVMVTSGTTGGTVMQPVQGQGQYLVQQPGTIGGTVMQPVQGQGQYLVQQPVQTSGTMGGTIIQPVQGQGQYMVQQPVQPGYWAVSQAGDTTAHSPANQSQAAGFAVASGTSQQHATKQQQTLKGSDAPPAYDPAQ